MKEHDRAPNEWLLLIHQLPAKPAYLRVKVWRRLQALGAAQVRSAVYALPVSEENLRLFTELVAEIVANRGEALICSATLEAGYSDDEMRALFDAARDADYDEFVSQTKAELATGEITEAELARLRERLNAIASIDFFGAHGRQAADSALAAAEELSKRHPDVSRAEPAPVLALSELKTRVWVTRRGVHVDRIGSAWLVRRFIDPDARFRFVDAKTYERAPGELRFDMAGAEFTHEGDRCTFETLCAQTNLQSDTALQAISEIVHELDVDDGKFRRTESAGVAAMITGICAATGDDDERLARGGAMFDGLYAHFSKRRGERE